MYDFFIDLCGSQERYDTILVDYSQIFKRMKTVSPLFSRLKGLFALLLVVSVIGPSCTPEGVINKTKYNGEKVTYTCDDFKADVENLVGSNSNTADLVVAEYDNSDFDYYYLEPGQWEIKDGMLNFRLSQDFEYEKFLTKGVAVHVIAKYKSLDHLAAIENPSEGEIGMLVVDEEYYNSHKNPFLLYQVPVPADADGRQISLEFSIVKYKKGKIKKEYCNTVEVPLGTATPACCTFQPWENTDLQSVIEMPEVEIPDERYRYRGFTGTLDFIFPMNSTKFDKDLLATAIEKHVRVYDSLGYNVSSISLEGYASLGGKEAFNQKLSQRRAKAVYDQLVKSMRDTSMQIEFAGKGEDWNRLVLLTKTSALTGDEQQQVLNIANGAGTVDEKEAEMRKLKFWDKLVDEVVVNTRHTFVTFNFDYATDKMWVEYYQAQMPVISDELYNIASREMTVSRWKGGDTKKGLKVLDILIGNNKKPNLFAMRSTYHFGANNIKSAISDIEQALLLDKGNLQYALAGLAYKTKFATTYSIEERMDMLNMYNDYVDKYPNNRSLFLNRSVMMDKAGYVSGALKEYDDLLEGQDPTAANLNNRGVAKLRTNRITEAEADFIAALEKDQALAEAYYNLAVIYAMRGLTDKAAQHMRDAVRYDSKLKDGIWSNNAFRVVRESDSFTEFR